MVDDQIVFGTLWATQFPLWLLNIEQRCPSKTICRHWWRSGFGQQAVVTDPWSKIKRTTDLQEKRNERKTWTPQKRLSALRINTWKGMLLLLVIWRSEVKSLQLCPTLCNPMDRSLPGSYIHGIFQARILEWVAISFSRGSFQPRDQTQVSCTVGRLFTIWTTREPYVLSLNQKNALFPNEEIGGVNRGEGSESRNWIVCLSVGN